MCPVITPSSHDNAGTIGQLDKPLVIARANWIAGSKHVRWFGSPESKKVGHAKPTVTP